MLGSDREASTLNSLITTIIDSADGYERARALKHMAQGVRD